MTAFNPLADAAAALGNTGKSTDKTPATLWLNIGVMVGETFVQLPVGIPLDNIKDLPDTARNRASKALLKSIVNHASDLPPGSDMELDSSALTLRIYRTEAGGAPTDIEKQDFTKLLFG